MPADLQPLIAGPPVGDTHGRALIQRGADLVMLTEELYLRLVLTLILTVAGCGISVWFAVIGTHTSVALTAAIAAVAGVPAAAALVRPRAWYCWLRYSRVRQASPALLAVIAVLCNGPDSPSWWVALPLLWLIAAVSSTQLALAAAFVAAAAYLAGTTLGGETLVHNGDAEILAAAVALPGNMLVGRLVAEVFARFVLRLHQLEQTPRPPTPVRVTVAPTAVDEAQPSEPQPARDGRVARLTSRELQALLLVRDGLQHGEIAAALGVSSRQVERLLASARASGRGQRQRASSLPI